jgi:hypothetical protein
MYWFYVRTETTALRESVYKDVGAPCRKSTPTDVADALQSLASHFASELPPRTTVALTIVAHQSELESK